MASQADISGVFVALRALIDETVASKLNPAERQKLRTLAEGGLRLAEWFLLDVNRIADALESSAYTANSQYERELGGH